MISTEYLRISTEYLRISTEYLRRELSMCVTINKIDLFVIEKPVQTQAGTQGRLV